MSVLFNIAIRTNNAWAYYYVLMRHYLSIMWDEGGGVLYLEVLLKERTSLEI